VKNNKKPLHLKRKDATSYDFSSSSSSSSSGDSDGIDIKIDTKTQMGGGGIDVIGGIDDSNAANANTHKQIHVLKNISKYDVAVVSRLGSQERDLRSSLHRSTPLFL